MLRYAIVHWIFFTRWAMHAHECEPLINYIQCNIVYSTVTFILCFGVHCRNLKVLLHLLSLICKPPLVYYRKWLFTHAQWKHLSNKLFTNVKSHRGGIRYTIKTSMSNIWQLSGGCLWILPRWRQLRQQLLIRSIDGLLMEKIIVGDFVSSSKVAGTWCRVF